MIYEGILGPHEGFQTLQKEPSDFPAGNLGVTYLPFIKIYCTQAVSYPSIICPFHSRRCYIGLLVRRPGCHWLPLPLGAPLLYAVGLTALIFFELLHLPGSKFTAMCHAQHLLLSPHLCLLVSPKACLIFHLCNSV